MTLKLFTSPTIKAALISIVIGLTLAQSSAICRGQEARKRTRQKAVSGGILDRRAIQKPTPIYPETALAARVSGTVVVRIVFDEDGNVETARAVSGHPLLRQAAVDAARQACFVPVRISGEPVKVSGLLVYSFQLPKDE